MRPLLAVGISGSPRADANKATAVADVLSGAGAASPGLDVVQLGVDGISPVGNCSAGVQRGACSIDDGFIATVERVTAADLLVLDTPLYWYGPSAQLKAFLDRWSRLLDLDGDSFRAARARVTITVGFDGVWTRLGASAPRQAPPVPA